MHFSIIFLPIFAIFSSALAAPERTRFRAPAPQFDLSGLAGIFGGINDLANAFGAFNLAPPAQQEAAAAPAEESEE